MKPLIIILIIILIITLVFLLRVRFIVYKNKNNKINVDLFVIPKLNIKIDLDKYMRKHFVKNNIIDSVYLVKNFNKYIENRRIVKDLLKKVTIRKIKVIICYDYFSYSDIYLNVLNFVGLSIIKHIVDSHTKKVLKEEYNIIYTKERKTDILIEGMINMYSLIIVGFKNIKYIIGGIKKHGASNK